MPKKVITLGAPAYMGQFTALMTILLAFFILLQSMSSQQESGFQEGIGEVKNAFGLQGGLGIFSYTFFGKGGSRAPNPANAGKKEDQGLHDDLVKSTGGSGNTELEGKDNDAGKFLRIRIEGDFPHRETKIPQDMADYLNKVGMGFSWFDYKISIRCYSDEFKSEDANRELSMARAAQIMRYLNQRTGVPFSRMTCMGYTTPAYFRIEDVKDYKDIPRQGNYFYIYIESKK